MWVLLLKYISNEINYFTSLHLATFLSLLYFNTIHVVKCVVYSKCAVSFSFMSMSDGQFTNESLF